ncbi:MAG TPA: ATP synthase F1 subunit epsilon [Candidatus Saccharimonadales bacterium]|nr:ATP synthase F1 subunit epsilon [Candidatus Saccharimonadales bacterium]
MKLQITVVTPEKKLLEQEADEIIIPTTEGEIAVLPEHISLLSQIAPGTLQIKLNGKTDHLAVMGGFLEVGHNKVTILADYAVHAKDISTGKAQEAKERAERAMKDKTSGNEFKVAQDEFIKAILELKVAKRVGKVS